MRVYIPDVVIDKTFALVQTVERDGRTALTTVPNRWTAKNFYPVGRRNDNELFDTAAGRNNSCGKPDIHWSAFVFPISFTFTSAKPIIS